MVKIVMGASSCGKSRFIQKHFADWSHHSVGDLQREIRKEQIEQGKVIIDELEVIVEANKKIKELVIKDLKEGKNVIMEHTLFKAKRRIGYVEAFKAVTDEPIDIYVMFPTDDELRANLAESDTCSESNVEYIKKQIQQIEIPNCVEGFSNVYAVTDGVIRKINAELEPNILTRAMQELMQEEEEKRKEEKKKKQEEALIEEMEQKGFWHYCSVCGKREFLTSREAYAAGWDYPGKHGIYKGMPNYGFRIMAPRKCGNCGIQDTLYFKLLTGEMNPDEKEGEVKAVIHRILKEPSSLLEEEL